MRVKCEITLDLEKGDYQIKLQNLSEPGQAIDYDEVMTVLSKVLANWHERQLENQQDSG